MNKKKLKWSGTLGEAIKLGKVTQEEADKYWAGRSDEEQEAYEEGKAEELKRVGEVIDKITSWTCECNCVTFDNKICRRCGKAPKYGEIDYEELKKEMGIK